MEKAGCILEGAPDRAEDTPRGARGDVIVAGNKADIFILLIPGASLIMKLL
jgi:hypothetical protein